MKKYKLNLVSLLIIASVAVMSGSMSFADNPPMREMSKLDCKTCHSCDNPTAANKCLKTCPSISLAHGADTHSLREAPDSMLLDDIADLYQAVHFNHKRHAGMSQMGGNCSTCHHYSPTDKIQPCKACHGGETNPADLRQPGLKGAYHRQCLACHREWSHDTKCILCHLPAEGKALDASAPDTTDIMGISHPIITEPEKKIYHTNLSQGPIVTFRHKEHIVLFGLRCVDCHKRENCSYCHDIKEPSSHAKTDIEIHAVCNDCHLKDRCTKCHDKRERPAFTHETTGWALNRYHRSLDCQACHPTGRKISKLNSECAGCHGGWSQDNFDHAVTGLQLDETHYAMGCTDCHLDRKFENKPDCSGCHDDGRTYDISPPGRIVKKM